MDVSSALLLGALQGITEFLPISSSGHLVIAQNFLGFKEPEVFFDVCLHIGTLISVLLVFASEAVDLVIGALRIPSVIFGKRRELQAEEKLFLLVAVGTLPTVLVALSLRHFLEDLFASVTAVSINLLITGTMLWATRYIRQRNPKRVRRTHWQDAILVGLAQAIALSPGISRSGATISAGLFVGLEREWAGKFSFLLFMPAVVGALILEFSNLRIAEGDLFPTLLGTAAAAVVGYVALRAFLSLVRNGNFYVFAPYCWALGLAGLTWSLFLR